MAELFGKSFTLFIFYFLIICSNTFADWSCTSIEGVPPEKFERKEFATIAYVKHVNIELARNLHLILNLDALDVCKELLNIETTYQLPDNTHKELRFDVPDPYVQKIMKDVFNTSFLMFELFNSLGGSEQMHLTAQNRRDINKLIRRLKRNYARGYQLKGLYIDGKIPKEAPSTPTLLFYVFPGIVGPSVAFSEREAENVGGQHALYVAQAEMAVTKTDDNYVGILGSGNASTCIIVMIKHTGAGVYGLAHIDTNNNTYEGMTALVKKVLELAGDTKGTLEMYMVGGFNDTEDVAEDIFFNIMDATFKQPVSIHLKLACVHTINTRFLIIGSRPKITGVAINLWDKENKPELFPARFIDKGPDMPLRTIRLLYVTNTLSDIYDFESAKLTIKPFIYEMIYQNIQFLSHQSDDYLRSYFGTSFNFAANTSNVREALEYMALYPSSEQAFPENKSRVYMKNEEGYWIESAED